MNASENKIKIFWFQKADRKWLFLGITEIKLLTITNFSSLLFLTASLHFTDCVFNSTPLLTTTLWNQKKTTYNFFKSVQQKDNDIGPF